jgi:predicted small secreted protein
MRRTRGTLAALAMVALISAGCSNAPAETGTGSNGGGNIACS